MVSITEARGQMTAGGPGLEWSISEPFRCWQRSKIEAILLEIRDLRHELLYGNVL